MVRVATKVADNESGIKKTVKKKRLEGNKFLEGFCILKLLDLLSECLYALNPLGRKHARNQTVYYLCKEDFGKLILGPVPRRKITNLHQNLLQCVHVHLDVKIKCLRHARTVLHDSVL